MIIFFRNLFNRTTQLGLLLPRGGKRLMAMILDVCICILTTWISFFLRLGEFMTFSITLAKPMILSVLIALPIFAFSGLYKTIFRFSGLPVIRSISYAMVFYSIIYFNIIMVFGVSGTPRTIAIIQPLLLFFLIVCSRLTVSFLFRETVNSHLNPGSLHKLIIYGAGVTGRQLANTLMSNENIQLIGYLDDDKRLQKQILNGISIFSPNDLKNLIIKYSVSSVLLAIPSAPRTKRREIIEFVSKHKVAVRTIPDLNDLAEGKVKVSDIYDLDVDDLLGREIVKPDETLLKKNVTSKIIVITGAGGSIGSELSRQLIKFKPNTIILIDKNEFNLYDINSKLEAFIEKNKNFNKTIIVPLIGSIDNQKFLERVFDTWTVDTIYHAAAYKHVPLVEYNVINSLYNNVIGTYLLSKISINKGIKNFILISTDKAVRPKNLMGASKRLSEIILQSLFAQQTSKDKTIISMVRFGNVLESSGSVIPKFRQQISDGGPITVTHPKVTRYFMTITEASQLVIQAGAMSEGGEVFVLDMGEQVLINDLAIRMVNLSGLSVKDDSNPEGDIEIEFVGLRPGEKLYEELLLGNNPQKTDHPKIKKANETYISWKKLEGELNYLNNLLDKNDIKKIFKLMVNLVKEFQPNPQIVDLTFNKKLNNDLKD